MENKLAPNFLLKDQDGNNKSLNDYSGKWLVLYVYPRDNTPGCTKEACTFRDERDEIALQGNAVVVGVSKDSVLSHRKFADKHHLNFTLLSDPDHELISALNSYKPSIIFGKKVFGTKRNTFIIDPKGLIVKEYLGVNPATNAKEIIEDLKILQNK
jgi:thioredoxin-dependent peroxiredoxin